MDIHQDDNLPSFILLPHHTDRTAWKDFGLPIILSVPHSLPRQGCEKLFSQEDTRVQRLKIYVAEKGRVPVAGHDNIGIFNPDYELYEISLNDRELEEKRINLDNTTIENDKISFTTKSGVSATANYINHAKYYDLSDIKIPVEQLPPNRYILGYEALYYRRTISDNDELICIDRNATQKSTYRFLLNHPGEVLMSMVDKTPGLYFGTARKSEDKTIEFYRPFSDILQDAHDEQNYLERVNWVNDLPPEHIPYLGFILGWELPYFPKSVDSLRRAVLRNMVRLQQLKGTKRAVRELFDLFGFAINIDNAWWTPDGKNYLAPNEHSTNPEHKITLQKLVTTEPLLIDYRDNGFGQLTVPLINRQPDQRITYRAYLARIDSPAHQFLKDISKNLTDDFKALDSFPPSLYVHLNSPVSQVESLDGLVGTTIATTSSDGFVNDIIENKDAPLNKNGIKHNYLSNISELTFSRFFDFNKENTVLYVFANYIYDSITVPKSMENLQSNRFDISIFKKDGEQTEPDIVLFLVDFLFRIKAFHSLLRKAIVQILADDVYQVTDFAIDGSIEQSIESDLGKQQVPPEAIIPNIPGDCPAYLPEDYGFRRWDLDYRNRIINGLREEFRAWSYDDCEFNKFGQNRSAEEPVESSDIIEGSRIDSQLDRDTKCELDCDDYRYISRINNAASYRMITGENDTWSFKPCGLGLGNGSYYILTNKINSILKKYLTSHPDIKDGFLSKSYKSYGYNVENIHYTNFYKLDSSSSDRWLGIIRPSLNIQKDNLGFPGHRLPVLGALFDDFVSPDWNAKPHDFPIICDCGGPKFQNPLNARIEKDNGIEILVYDETPYAIEGNGLKPDISSLGGHVISGTTIDDPEQVTHKIYTDQYDGHQAIQFDNFVNSDDVAGIVQVNGGSFPSASVSGTDFAAGYPADSGFFGGTDGLDFLFTLGSQIKVGPSEFNYDFYRHNRLDCGCLKYADGTSADDNQHESIIACPVSEFIDKYGNSDNDQVETDLTMLLDENMLVRTVGLDGEGSLFSVDGGLSGSGSFSYKDSYGTIYEIQWETIGPFLDFITIIREPRIWGVSSGAGTIINREVYRDGIITITRRIFAIADDGYFLMASAFDQEVGRFQSTYLCNSPFSDPFEIHLGNNIQDSVDYLVSDGSAWSSTDPSSADTTWAEVNPATGDENMVWINAFSN